MLDNMVDFDPSYIKPGRVVMTDAMLLSDIYVRASEIQRDYEASDVSSACTKTLARVRNRN